MASAASVPTVPVTVYIRPLAEAAAAVSVDFSSDDTWYDFRHRLHESNLSVVEDLLKAHAPVLPDLAAAVLAHFQERGLIQPLLFRSALDYCHQLVIDCGYRVSSLAELHRQPDGTDCHAMLVTGCQDREILRARVRAAHTTVQALSLPFRVLFSGLNPMTTKSGGRVRTVNEAREMYAYFEQLRASNPVTIEYAQALDEQAHDTARNIRAFLDSGHLDRNRPNQVYIASSTFHLPEIAETLSSFLEVGHSANIRRVVMIGAETHPSPGEIPSESRYLKAMMYEVLKSVFAHRALPAGAPVSIAGLG